MHYLVLILLLIKCANTTNNKHYEENFQKMSTLSGKENIIDLDLKNFQQLVNTENKNYSVIVLFTTLPPYNDWCGLCQIAWNEYYQVHWSFVRSPEYFEKKIFFAKVEYENAPDIFEEMHLKKIPVFLHFPPYQEPNIEDHLNIKQHGVSSKVLIRWIGDNTNVWIRLLPETSYKQIFKLLMIITLVLMLIHLHASWLHSGTFYGLAACLFAIVLPTGVVWNHTSEDTDFVGVKNTGDFEYFHSSTNKQYGIESCVLMVLNGAVTLGFILLMKAKYARANKYTCFGMFSIVCGFGLMLYVVRFKSPEYPYRLVF